MSESFEAVRPSIIPSLLESESVSGHATYPHRIFEVGKVAFLEPSDNSGTATAVTAAMKVVLRKQNIVFLPVMGGAEFDNGSYTITYVANNGASPAEEDVQISAVAGDTYTILNNSDSRLGFTAPATKSFSKWNTKADGTGTDYAAAASYTVAADLTLYAVWA
jgi:phenylalanyl-tRNA synthetase beta subunit